MGGSSKSEGGELLGDGRSDNRGGAPRPEQFWNASRQLVSAQARQPGALGSAAHSLRHEVATQADCCPAQLAQSALSEFSCRHCAAQSGPWSLNNAKPHVVPQLVTSAFQAELLA